MIHERFQLLPGTKLHYFSFNFSALESQSSSSYKIQESYIFHLERVRTWTVLERRHVRRTPDCNKQVIWLHSWDYKLYLFFEYERFTDEPVNFTNVVLHSHFWMYHNVEVVKNHVLLVFINLILCNYKTSFSMRRSYSFSSFFLSFKASTSFFQTFFRFCSLIIGSRISLNWSISRLTWSSASLLW